MLTAGPACAPLRSPAKVLLRQLLPGREGYLALKDEALLRHAAACIGAAPPAPADAPMLEGDDAADAVAPPPVTARRPGRSSPLAPRPEREWRNGTRGPFWELGVGGRYVQYLRMLSSGRSTASPRLRRHLLARDSA